MMLGRASWHCQQEVEENEGAFISKRQRRAFVNGAVFVQRYAGLAITFICRLANIAGFYARTA
jgi:hypothetical protein